MGVLLRRSLLLLPSRRGAAGRGLLSSVALRVFLGLLELHKCSRAAETERPYGQTRCAASKSPHRHGLGNEHWACSPVGRRDLGTTSSSVWVGRRRAGRLDPARCSSVHQTHLHGCGTVTVWITLRQTRRRGTRKSVRRPLLGICDRLHLGWRPVVMGKALGLSLLLRMCLLKVPLLLGLQLLELQLSLCLLRGGHLARMGLLFLLSHPAVLPSTLGRGRFLARRPWISPRRDSVLR